MKKVLIIGIVSVLVLGGCGEAKKEDKKVGQLVSVESVPFEPTDVVKYSTVEVAKHNSEKDCWTIVDNKVYNLTSFVSGHPGGKAILKACGVDGTELFKNQPRHGEGAMKQLEALFIGEKA